jgi:hypothetical protein
MYQQLLTLLQNDEYTEQCYDQQPARDVHEFALSDAGDDRDADRSFVDEQLPSSLIVTNVDSAVFADDAIRVSSISSIVQQFNISLHLSYE